MLNMRSVLEVSDITARGRILEAALELFSANGFRATTVRSIAHSAGVSAGLVLHHFASKDGLRRECDDRVVRFITAKGAGAAADVVTDAASQFGPYIARMLYEAGDVSDTLFDRLLGSARDAVDAGVSSGSMAKSSDLDAQAVALLTMGVAPFFLATQLARWAGGDAEKGFARVAVPIADIYARGLFVDTSQPVDESQKGADR